MIPARGPQTRFILNWEGKSLHSTWGDTTLALISAFRDVRASIFEPILRITHHSVVYGMSVSTIGSMLQSQTIHLNPCLLQLSMSVCGLSLGQVARASHLSRVALWLENLSKQLTTRHPG